MSINIWSIVKWCKWVLDRVEAHQWASSSEEEEEEESDKDEEAEKEEDELMGLSVKLKWNHLYREVKSEKEK